MQAYQKLGPLERRIVQSQAVAFLPMSEVRLLKCLQALGQGGGGPDLRLALTRLKKGELLLPDNRCPSALREAVTRTLVASGEFPALAQAIREVQPASYWRHMRQPSRQEAAADSYSLLLREYRLDLYGGEGAALEGWVALAQKEYPVEYALGPPFLTLFGPTPDLEWLATLPPAVKIVALEEVVPRFLFYCQPMQAVRGLLEQHRALPGELGGRFRGLLVECLLLMGEPDGARALLRDPQGVGVAADLGWAAWLDFLAGDIPAALPRFEAELKALRKQRRRTRAYFNDLTGLLHLLCLVASQDPAQQRRIIELIDLNDPHHLFYFPTAYAALQSFAQSLFDFSAAHPASARSTPASRLRGRPARDGRGPKARSGDDLFGDDLLDELLGEDEGPFAIFFQYLTRYWLRGTVDRGGLARLREVVSLALVNGHAWLARECSGLLARLDAKGMPQKTSPGERYVVDLYHRQEPWERALGALVGLSAGAATAGNAKGTPGGSKKRLAWFLQEFSGGCTLTPREQSLDKQGGWSGGRNVALKRLAREANDFPYLTPQDRKICQAIETQSVYYGAPAYFLDADRALPELVGHPLVFWEDAPGVSIELVAGTPELLVTSAQGQITLALAGGSQIQDMERGVLLIRESPIRCKVIRIAPIHRQIAEILGGKGLSVPQEAEAQAVRALSALAPLVTVHSQIGGETATATQIEADPTPCLFLLPAGSGFICHLLVQPFAQGGPSPLPGEGGRVLFAEIDGQRAQTARDLQKEMTLAQEVIAACPTLAAGDLGHYEWRFEGPEDCLPLLLELHALGEAVRILWPEGERLRITAPVATNAMQLRIERQADWFRLEGELRVADDQVVEMKRLLELMEGRKGRFLPLGEGQFLALTDSLHQRLQELRAYSEATAQGRRLHPLTALALDDLGAGGVRIKADKHWKALTRRVQEAEQLDPPIPSTLQAELRDYQVDGFRWLARLAHMGMGACLADDMGLGKTVQALALILNRAAAGPTLVVAPLSVTINWIEECARFAPTLVPIPFAGPQRQGLLDGLKPFDLVVVSYGLLQQDGERFAEIPWQTVILDEAQAIKNSQTKRSQAVMALQAGFKVVTTGTPIENHLGELWNLFQFINPGFLGSAARFTKDFAAPIERKQDPYAVQRLKKLIQPFILRRTKTQVLAELPPCTEIVMHVDLGEGEAALYEALRQELLASLATLPGAADRHHIQILAAITKLRRFCCHHRLVVPEARLPSAKLEVFGEIVAELLDNRHKALVFSQFVDYLGIVRAYLDRQGIPYQYLDGSTSAKARQERIAAFQAGEGSLFLISLKAGGVGLNLTAADYVIHLDPWWNPAVEDQASNRAHRIGQERPVTVYRLVTRQTIEEKIVRLHQRKRSLADSLLEGNELTDRIGAEEILALMREAVE
jgi:superfamily II DNA or RNA helicase